jgi:hypothetical protein
MSAQHHQARQLSAAEKRRNLIKTIFLLFFFLRTLATIMQLSEEKSYKNSDG